MKGYKELFSFLAKTKEIISPIIFTYLKVGNKKYQDIVMEYPKRMGKYLRPSLVLLSSKLYGGDPKDAYLLACAMQLSEEWLLIHDDIEDHSKERRSTKEEFRPTLNQIFGDEIALNTGDTLHTIMWKVLGDYIKKTGKWEIFDKFNDIIIKTTEGQFAEISWIKEQNFDVSEKDYFNMIDQKTGLYSIIGPMTLGALSANAKDEDILSLVKIGIPLGRAFQIKDDTLNFTSESEIAGKERYSDIKEGKRSLIFINLLKKCSFIEKSYVKSIYASETKRNDPENIKYIINLINKYGCIKEVEVVTKKYIKQARNLFTTTYANNKQKETVKIILQLIDFIDAREN